MHIFSLITVFNFILLKSASAYKILGIFPSPERSNYLVYAPVFRELANRDNDVTLISNFVMLNPPLNYKEILLSKDAQVKLKQFSFDSVISSDSVRVLYETLLETKSGNEDCKVLMADDSVRKFLNDKVKFDLIVVEQFDSDCALALAYKLGAPYIGLAPDIIRTWMYNRLGMSYNPSFEYHHGLSYGNRPSFLERVTNCLLFHSVNVINYLASQVTDHVLLYKHLGDDLPSLESIARNMSLLLANTHLSVQGAFSRPPNVVEIGGVHIKRPRMLPPDLDEFMGNAQHGVIYINFGDAVNETSLPHEKLNDIVTIFSKLPLRVVWQWDNRTLNQVPRNFMVKRWIPQFDVLSHSKVVAFVTSGDTLSALEAAKSGVPALVLPCTGTQHAAAAALRDAGTATVLHYHQLNQMEMTEALNQVLDPRMKVKAQLLSQILQDRQNIPLDTAIYWIEYVARYKGAPHIRSPSVDVPAYQYHQLDVLTFLSVIFFCLAYIQMKVSCFLLGCCCNADEVEEVPQEIMERSRRRKKRD